MDEKNSGYSISYLDPLVSENGNHHHRGGELTQGGLQANSPPRQSKEEEHPGVGEKACGEVQSLLIMGIKMMPRIKSNVHL